MGSCCGNDAPEPPNPIATAAAQTGTNVSTAIANSYLGSINQQTPTGNLTNKVTGNFGYTDPTTGQTFSIPRWTAQQSLLDTQGYLARNPDVLNAARNSGQDINQFAIDHYTNNGYFEGRYGGDLNATQQQTNASKLNMAQIANQQSGAIEGLLSNPLNANRGNFDASAYLQQNPDVLAAARSSGQNLNEFAQQHYQQFGNLEGRDPGGMKATPMGNINSLNFDVGSYLQARPDVAAAAARAGEDPNTYAQRHYQQFGANEMPGQGFNYNAKTGFDATPGMQFGYGSGGDIQSTYGSGGDITRSYGPQDNFSADRSRVEAGLMERLNPQLQIEQDRLRNQLANQGINYGATAYNNAFDVYNRQANDARLAVIGQAGTEQQRLNQMAQQQAQFQNAAQAQAYGQNQASAQFFNQAQAQREGQAAARSAFYNQAADATYNQAAGRASFFNQAQNQNFNRANQVFNQQQAMRNQSLAEIYQQRNQPLNELSALLSGSQVQAPQFINAARTQIPTTDVASIINKNFDQQADIYKTNQAFWGDIIGGGLGFAGGVMKSDVREKENIEPLGSVFGAKGERVPMYAFDYKRDDPDGRRHVGPMAQDIERIDPSAVVERDGVKHIRRDKLGSIFGARHG